MRISLVGDTSPLRSSHTTCRSSCISIRRGIVFEPPASAMVYRAAELKGDKDADVPPWFEVVESCGALMPPSWVRRCASTSASAAAAPSGFKFAFSPQSPCLKVLGLGRYRFGLGKKGELGTRKSWSRACCWHWGSVTKELERTSQRAARLAPWASTLASSASKLAPWESTLANVSSRWNAPDFSKSTAASMQVKSSFSTTPARLRVLDVLGSVATLETSTAGLARSWSASQLRFSLRRRLMLEHPVRAPLSEWLGKVRGVSAPGDAHPACPTSTRNRAFISAILLARSTPSA
mmetsp:Transcript_12123/g.23034  ORF Transcript_12123/g.23034 Transcript_12123/m.23034 type:complete len:293 (-) Transcript_12123:186-1064(-)